jgi:hypothetical protein
MKRVFRTREQIAEREHKPGFYVAVSCSFIAENDDIATVVCAQFTATFWVSGAKWCWDSRTACRARAPSDATL